VLYGIGIVAKQGRESALLLGLATSQGGEFAFVLFNVAVGAQVMGRELADLLVVVVSVSMAATPLLFMGYERLVAPRLNKKGPAKEFDHSDKDEVPVIIAGFGRVGQVVGRILRAKRIRFTALDASSEHIDFLKRFGAQIYYGDASRLDLLRAARADKARIFVLATDDVAGSLRIAKTVQEHFPHLIIYARARNRDHAYQLLDMGITRVFRETMGTSLSMTGEVLQGMGLPFTESQQAIERFRLYDEGLLRETYQHRHDLGKLQERAKKAFQELEQLFDNDAQKKDVA
jgi:glutathione-regulated potassium-efflux system protein KefB